LRIEECGLRIDRGLRIEDCGLKEVAEKMRVGDWACGMIPMHRSESAMNPQSIRNPQSSIRNEKRR
jgi:hypothetical protein